MKAPKNQFDEDEARWVVYTVQRHEKELLDESRFLPKNPTAHLPSFVGLEVHLGKLIGSGSFSRVYEIKSLELLEGSVPEKKRSALAEQSKQLLNGKSPLVVKHLRGKLIFKPDSFREYAKDLVMEANYLATIQHPHIISIRGVATGGAQAYMSGRHNSYFIILDRIECTLLDRMEQWSKQIKKLKPAMLGKLGAGLGGASSDQVLFEGRLKIIRDIASAMAYLHSRNLVHRDLKPGNIGFDANGNVKLFDFGLILEMAKGQREILIRAGTPRYMAPECYQMYPYNRSVDVYALTMTLWECLALRTAFTTLGAAARNSAIESGLRPEMHDDWPVGVKALMQIGWHQESRTRPTMKYFHQQLVNELEELKSPADASDSSKGTQSTSETTRSGWLKEMFYMVHPTEH